MGDFFQILWPCHNVLTLKVVKSLKVLSCLLDLQMNEQKDSPYSLMTIPSKRWPPLLNDHKSTHLLFILLFLEDHFWM